MSDFLLHVKEKWKEREKEASLYLFLVLNATTAYE